jgi:hypothetical protein
MTSNPVPANDELQLKIRPSYKETFKPRPVKDLMKAIMNEYLKDKIYNMDETANWNKEIATLIKKGLKGKQQKHFEHF